MSNKMRIGVVLVTRNRLEKLKITLDLYEKQTKRPEYIIVVDNCSTDSVTGGYLDEWSEIKTDYKKIVIHSEVNGGGSGGFYLAEKEALKQTAEWIWHADDDAYPDKNALEEIANAYERLNNNVAAYSASVKDVENPTQDISYWRKLYKGFFFVKWIPVKADDKLFDVDKFMYLGCVIKKDVLENVGLTNKDMFIHEDDIEHSLRIRKAGRIIAVSDACLFHPAWSDSIDPSKINWKYYYSVRNKILSIGMNLGKKYWMSEVLKAKLKYIKHRIQRYPENVLRMEKEAIRDGRNNVIGINCKYVP